MDIRLEDALGCFGYWGFGGGYEMGEAERDDREHDGFLYCNLCPQSALCMARHAGRTTALYKGMSEEFGKVLMENGNNVIQSQQEFVERHQTIDPFSLVVGCNVEDGRECGKGDKPLSRRRGSLTWPLTRLEHIEDAQGVLSLEVAKEPD